MTKASRRRKVQQAPAETVETVSAWRTIKPALISILVAMLLGCAIEFLIVPRALHNISFVKHLGDGIADTMIRRSAADIGTTGANSRRFTFIDIDEETWDRWGTPLVTRRDKLLTIMKRLAKSKPLAVIVDIDLSWPRQQIGEEAAPGPAEAPVPPAAPAATASSEGGREQASTSGDPEGANPKEQMAPAAPHVPDLDERLATWLANYGAENPPLFLMRLLITRPGGPAIVRSTFLDEYLNAHPDKDGNPLRLPQNVRWVLPFYDVDRDGFIRHWRLVKSACQDNAPQVLPSAQLAVSLMFAEQKDRVANELARLTPQSCGAAKAADAPFAPVRFTRDGRHWIELKHIDEALNERIIYTIPWERNQIGLGPDIKSEVGGTSELGPLVKVVPAWTIADSIDDGPLPVAADSIVIIGGSFESSGDIQVTPLGDMPGALVIVNSIHQLLTYGTQVELSRSWHLAIGFMMVIVNALLFHFLRPAVALAAALSAVAILMIVTVPYFRSGLALDLEVPSAGVLLHRFFVSLEMAYAAVRRDGLRALLRGH